MDDDRRTHEEPEAIDRLCARLGAGPVATSRRGMGWLLTEVIPVFVTVDEAVAAS